MDAAGQNFMDERWSRYLSAGRQEAAAGIRQERHRQLFLGAEALLNRSLEAAGAPVELPAAYTRNRHGKPYLTAAEGLYVNLSGCNGMASGGSGDVLAGLITGLLAQHISPEMAAVLGAFLQGRAGEEAATEKGNASMLASDILEKLPCVIKRSLERSGKHWMSHTAECMQR